MRPNDLDRPLYVSRNVLNTEDIIEWAKSQGLESMLAPEELHVTICYSKKAMSWDVPDSFDTIRVPSLDEFEDDEEPLRQMELFGKEHNVLVLQFESDELYARWQEFCDHGASYDFPEYKSHITITYKGASFDEDALDKIEPYRGELKFGPEIFKKIEKQWAGDAKEIDLTEAAIAEKRQIIPTGWEDEQIIVNKNPTVGEIKGALQRTTRGALRGSCIGGCVYMWDAFEAAHWTVHSALADLGEIGPGGGAKFLLALSIATLNTETDWSQGEIYSTDRGFYVLGSPRVAMDPRMQRTVGKMVLVGKRKEGEFTLLHEDHGNAPPRPETFAREPARPRTFFGYCVDRMRALSKAKGMPVKIEAEEAIDKGVPSEYIFFRNGAIRAPANKVFASRKGSLRSREIKLVSLDWDDIDPEQWGFEEPLQPEDIGGLLAASFEGDPDALDRRDPRYDRYMEWSARQAESMEFWDRHGDENGNLLSPEEVGRIRAEYPPTRIPDDEIEDNWQDDNYWRSVGDDWERNTALKEARTELAGSVRVTVNPSLGQLTDMCSADELRGVTDGQNVYVWSSMAATHMQVMDDLGISMNHYPTRFYAFMPEFGETPEDAQDRLEGNGPIFALYRLPTDAVIAAGSYSLSQLQQVPTVQRWFNRQPAMPKLMAEGAGCGFEIEALTIAAGRHGVELGAVDHGSHVRLVHIKRTPAAKKGMASQIIRKLCDIADRNGRAITLYAVSAATGLMRYYELFGFKSNRNPDPNVDEEYHAGEMIRLPKGTITENARLPT